MDEPKNKHMYIRDEASLERNTDELSRNIEREYKYYAELGKRKRFRTMLIVSSAMVAAFSLSLLLLPGNIEVNLPPFQSLFISALNSNVSVGLVGLAAIAAFVKYFLSYLQPRAFENEPKPKKTDTVIGVALSRYERKISDLENKFDTILKKFQNSGISGEFFSPEEKNSMLRSIQEKLESESFESYFEKLSSTIKNDQKYKHCEDIFKGTTSRLELEILSQTRRGNLNLILGILTTLIGVLILGYSVFQAPALTTNIEMAAHFLPRLSLVILVEVFAYFFLRLYRQSLEEIKYFQNEMTNIESKYLGFYIASESATGDGLLNVITQLTATERNFLLEKGQSTTQIELKKIEMTTANNVIDKLGAAFADITKAKN